MSNLDRGCFILSCKGDRNLGKRMERFCLSAAVLLLLWYMPEKVLRQIIWEAGQVVGGCGLLGWSDPRQRWQPQHPAGPAGWRCPRLQILHVTVRCSQTIQPPPPSHPHPTHPAPSLSQAECNHKPLYSTGTLLTCRCSVHPWLVLLQKVLVASDFAALAMQHPALSRISLTRLLKICPKMERGGGAELICSFKIAEHGVVVDRKSAKGINERRYASGIVDFGTVEESHIQAAMPLLKAQGVPYYVHAEIPDTTKFQVPFPPPPPPPPFPPPGHELQADCPLSAYLRQLTLTFARCKQKKAVTLK